MDFVKKWMHKVPAIGEKPKEVKPPKKGTYQHQAVVNNMLKAITDTPMSDQLKMILRMRIWGKHPQIFSPMSYHGIAKSWIKDGLLTHKNKADAIEAIKHMEEEAKYHVKAHLKRVGMFDINGRFDADNLIEGIVVPKNRITV